MKSESNADPGPSFSDYVKTLPQYVLPHHLVSRLFHAATRSQLRPWKDGLIRWFIGHYNVDMTIATEPDPAAYPDFNSFFTRPLRPDARPVTNGAHDLACPVDGTVSQLGDVEDDTLLQAKGRHYALLELLGDQEELVARFRNGRFVTLYLSPRDYHRIHMPLHGTLRQMVYVPGRLFSVNARTTRVIPKLFARNERVICVFETELGYVALILVGAINVGSIETVWSGPVTPPYGKAIRAWQYSDTQAPITLARGQEMGRFNMGSTVIALFGPGRIAWSTALRAGSDVAMGQKLATALVHGS